MKLIELKVSNYKGLHNFTFRPEGKNSSVYGRNFSGKSTLASAWAFLLTGKDAQGKSPTGKSSFEIKKIVDGKVEHGAENTVEGTNRCPTVTCRNSLNPAIVCVVAVKKLRKESPHD